MSLTDQDFRQNLTAKIFHSDGELARRCREKHWSQTPLGPVASWSTSLRTAAGLVVASPTPMILLWGEQLVQIYNDGYRDVMGNKHPVGLGQPNRDCWPEVWEFTAPIYRGVIERGESFNFDDQRLVLERNGRPEEAFFTLTYSPVLDDDGDIVGVLATVLETTATVKRLQAEEALHESETRFHAIADLVPDMLWQADPGGQRVWCNHRWTEYTGQSSQEASGYGWAETIHPNERNAVLHKYRRAMETGVRFRNEHRMRRVDGSYGWFLVEAVPIYDDAGDILHWFGSANDINDQRMTMDRLEELVAERTQSLAESEERFRLLVTTSAQIIWSTDAEGHAAEDSPSWRAFTGQDAECWLAGGWWSAVHPDDIASTERAWQIAVGSGQPFVAEYRLWHARSGNWRWVTARGIPLCDGVGRTLGWFGTNTDIDERKRAEEEVRRMAYSLTMAEQEERRRVSQILHDDLQQLLYALQLKLRMVINRLALEKQSALAEMVEEARVIIKQAITTTRQLTVDLSPPILKTEGLADALEWLQRQMLELHGLDVELVSRPVMPSIDKDLLVMLFQVVRELLFNVKKHAGVERATVVLEQADRDLIIRVEDDGLGISKSADVAFQGTGFGLSSIRERLRQVGGSMGIDSSAGAGMRVTIRVPCNPIGISNAKE